MDSTNGFFASSPSVVMPADAPNAYFQDGHFETSPTLDPRSNGMNHSLAPATSLPVTPGSIAGRKRSRGDIHAPEDDEVVQDDGSTIAPANGLALQTYGETILSPVTTLMHVDNSGYEARPESRSGLWVEDRAELNQFQQLNEKRPSISARKSQRMDSGADGSDDLAQLVLPPQIREVTAEPLIDEATRILGISWTRMDSTEALRINQAAYSKWIQNHYTALKDVTIWFENSAIPGYLVAGQNTYNNRTEYYIFSHDLTEARLVTSEAEQLIPRLQMLPALELAAPGGCIRAETDAIVPVEAPKKSLHYARMSEDFSMHPMMMRGYFPSMDAEMMD